ncbi:hypothetical protein LTR17_003087 [Elasticomyces elasticus]|nr:hypothetical protein LTR17_003087 [Elasticomyces elasticus]
MDQQRLYMTLPPTTDQDEHDVEDSLAPDWLELLNRQESSSSYSLYSPSMKEWAVDLREFEACSKRAAQIMQQVRSRSDRIGAVQAATVRRPDESSKNQKHIVTGSRRTTNDNIHRQEVTNGLRQTQWTSASVEVSQSHRSNTATSVAIYQNIDPSICDTVGTTSTNEPCRRPNTLNLDWAICNTINPKSTSSSYRFDCTASSEYVGQAKGLEGQPSSCNMQLQMRLQPKLLCTEGWYEHPMRALYQGTHQSQLSAQVPPTMPHLLTTQPMPSTARPTTAADLSGPSQTMAQPQPRRVTELQRPGYGSDQSVSNGALQQSSSSRLNSATADDRKQDASQEGIRGVEQAVQTSQACTTTDEVQVSSKVESSAVDTYREFVDQSQQATEKGKAKRKVQDDDEDLERALATGEDKRRRRDETGQDGWRRSF